MITKTLILITLMITSCLTIHLNRFCPKVFERLSPCGVVISTQIPRGFYAYKKMKEILLNTVRSTSPYYKKYVALIDDEDYGRVIKYKWRIEKGYSTFYARAEINGKQVYMHKFITGLEKTDHIDGYGLNNQKHNLRECTQQ